MQRDLPPRDRLASVFFAATEHDEDQPVHLQGARHQHLRRPAARSEYGNPCTRFCPANVYEIVDDGAGGKRLQINAANCVHCKTCDIKDPYEIITWVTPEGGSGPNYQLAVSPMPRRSRRAVRARESRHAFTPHTIAGGASWPDRAIAHQEQVAGKLR